MNEIKQNPEGIPIQSTNDNITTHLSETRERNMLS